MRARSSGVETPTGFVFSDRKIGSKKKLVMNTAWLCVTVCVCFMMKKTDAEVTAWTTPAISSKDGTGTIEEPLRDDTNTFPLLVAIGATNYVLISQDPAGIFEIPDPSTGQLALADGQKLDYATTESHELVVTADDGANSTGTATIHIDIADVNDNPPVFTESTYSACVLENATIGDIVLTVSTTDADGTTGVNVISAMTITANNTNNDFSIAMDGVITLAKALDIDRTARYTLNVEAVDSDRETTRTGTTTASITVADPIALKCDGGGSGVGILAASLLAMLVGVMTSLSLL